MKNFLLACPVCYQPVDEVVRTSMNLGIGVLLATTIVVLACFARFFVSLARRSREIESARLEPATTHEAR